MSDVLDRIFARVVQDGECWRWTGAISLGYGSMGYNGRTHGVHRLVYREMVSDDIDGLVLDHLCRNRWCVNPYHLDPVTIGENVRRGTSGQYLAARTHCPKGHEYAGDNLRIHKRGSRVCVACHREADRAWARKKRASAQRL